MISQTLSNTKILQMSSQKLWVHVWSNLICWQNKEHCSSLHWITSHCSRKEPNSTPKRLEQAAENKPKPSLGGMLESSPSQSFLSREKNFLKEFLQPISCSLICSHSLGRKNILDSDKVNCKATKTFSSWQKVD